MKGATHKCGQWEKYVHLDDIQDRSAMQLIIIVILQAVTCKFKRVFCNGSQPANPGFSNDSICQGRFVVSPVSFFDVTC